MAKPGRKPRNAATADQTGETRPSRAVVALFPDHASRPDPENIPPPAWLTAPAKAIWKEKVDRYRQRNQKVQGFESSLAQYCALEAELLSLRKKRIIPPVAMITAQRVWAAEFYDTPASQNIKPGQAQGAGNPFGAIGKRTS